MSGPTDERVLTVSEVTAQVKAVIESTLPTFWVEGELSNFVHHTSGHMYFTLKDASSQLPSVMFRHANRALAFRPESGMKVVAWGRIKVYEPSGRYQLYVESMKQAGLGALAAAFERLKRRLSDEGLFAQEHKRPIPEYPRTVAVVTSATGAAVRDIIRVIGERFPATRVVVVPVHVQGPEAAAEIVRAVAMIDEWGEADVAIVGRGGGSLEDLMAFNDEAVARSIYAARTPIVSAVGHEIDVTIADLVADVRASTPSNAAELVVQDRRALGPSIESLRGRLVAAAEQELADLGDRVRSFARAYVFRLPGETVERLMQRTDELARRLAVSAASGASTARARLERALSELRLADPRNIMAKGFAAVSLLPALSPVRSVEDVAGGAAVRVTVSDGFFDCDVLEVTAKSGGEQ
ncbi:MAG: exodeoxyribonuclease VII large subunit [Candidatus Eisenbacteria bacterium]|nr:exodeoxyribonuclease VII large subunit [Candidatus Eisenbacteria bacterium]